ncbi:MAG TPA: hypothetical protein DEO31_03845 [Streptococcus sp.]|nr:hypothetical protein [Streptococcus sp.]
MLVALLLFIILIAFFYQVFQIAKIPKPTREQYRAIIKSCNLRKIGAGISVDDNKQIFVLPGVPYIPIPFSDIVSIETEEKTRQRTTTTGSIKKKGAVTRGALGWALFGPLGGIVGAASAKKVDNRKYTTETVTDKFIVIHTKNPYRPFLRMIYTDKLWYQLENLFPTK